MKKICKIKLDPEEIKKLEDVCDIDCHDISCSECPYNIPDSNLEQQ